MRAVRKAIIIAWAVTALLAFAQEAPPPAASVPGPPHSAGKTPAATEIIDRSLGKYRENLSLQRNYIFRERAVEQELDGSGNVKKTQIRSYEVSMPCRDWYEKLVAKEDKPLSEKDQKRESEKLDKHCSEVKKHEEQHEREMEKWKEKHSNDGEPPPLDKDERDEREIADGIKKVYDFHLDGKEQIDGREVYVISAEPRPEYKPDKRWEHLLAKMRGKLWIDAADFQVVKAEANLFEDFHIGLFLFKLNKGTQFQFEQTRINGETWLPSREYLKGSGRIAFITGRFQQNTTYSDYQKFRTDVKITGMVSEPDSQQQNQARH